MIQVIKRKAKRIRNKIARRCLKHFSYKILKNWKLLNLLFGEREVSITTYRKFGLMLVGDFEKICREISSNRKTMVIRRGLWSNKYFNVACLNNTISLILYALSNGYVPVIEINADEEEYFHWDWFFLQPAEIVCPNGLDGFSKTDCDVQSIPYNGGWEFYLSNSEDFAVWSFLYRTFVSMNDETLAYILKEENNLKIAYSSTLGVLARGTDYISTRPQGHPIQPELLQLADAARKHMKQNSLSKIYLATEEERIYRYFVNEFGEDNILVNERTYYDNEYREGGLIGEVHFSRPRDNYWKSIEYLSSLIIISKCSNLCAGNCGGTKFALLYSKTYKSPFVFNLGYYP